MTKLSAIREWEILDVINTDEAKREPLLAEWGNKVPLNYLLSLNFRDDIKLDLPEGQPPFERDEATNSDFQGALAHNIHRLRNCFPGGSLPKVKKELMFIQMLESIPPRSADILCACKDKALGELYPNITKELIQKVLPGLV